jgi:hypothetical protein
MTADPIAAGEHQAGEIMRMRLADSLLAWLLS